MNSHSSGANGNNHTLWILDIGATDHITFNISLFLDYKSIVHNPVSLPDGSQANASISGTVAISPFLTLHNVLYIPSFHVNLVYIAKHVESNVFFVQFSVNSCHILQNNSKAMIGIANMQRGLYILNFAYHHSSFSSIRNNSCNTWNLILGDVSYLGLQVISKKITFITCNNKLDPCDSCHFAKKRKLPFSNSTSFSSDPFNILHVDLWNTFSTISTLGHKYFLALVNDYTRYTWVMFLKTKY